MEILPYSENLNTNPPQTLFFLMCVLKNFLSDVIHNDSSSDAHARMRTYTQTQTHTYNIAQSVKIKNIQLTG